MKYHCGVYTRRLDTRQRINLDHTNGTDKRGMCDTSSGFQASGAGIEKTEVEMFQESRYIFPAVYDSEQPLNGRFRCLISAAGLHQRTHVQRTQIPKMMNFSLSSSHSSRLMFLHSPFPHNTKKNQIYSIKNLERKNYTQKTQRLLRAPSPPSLLSLQKETKKKLATPTSGIYPQPKTEQKHKYQTKPSQHIPQGPRPNP